MHLVKPLPLPSFLLLVLAASTALIAVVTAVGTSTHIICFGELPDSTIYGPPPIRAHHLNRRPPGRPLEREPMPLDLHDLCATHVQLTATRGTPYGLQYHPMGWRAGLQCWNGQLRPMGLWHLTHYNWDLVMRNTPDPERVARWAEMRRELAMYSLLEAYCTESCMCLEEYERIMQQDRSGRAVGEDDRIVELKGGAEGGSVQGEPLPQTVRGGGSSYVDASSTCGSTGLSGTSLGDEGGACEAWYGHRPTSRRKTRLLALLKDGLAASGTLTGRKAVSPAFLGAELTAIGP